MNIREHPLATGLLVITISDREALLIPTKNRGSIVWGRDGFYLNELDEKEYEEFKQMVDLENT